MSYPCSAIVSALFLIVFTLTGCSSALPTAPGTDQQTLAALQGELESQASQIAAQGTIVSHLATRPAIAVTPRTPGAEPTPYRPVYGSVRFEDGRCCIGGQPGTEVSVRLQFGAASPAGDVDSMRFRVAPVQFQETDFTDDEWQPYVPEVTVALPVALNWVGYHASAQFRDSAGNLSVVIYDDIAVEGTP